MDTAIIDWRTPAIKRRLIEDDPLDWPTIFGNMNPMDLEIGIGNGSFLVPFCAQNKLRNMVGIEIDGFYLKKADRKLHQTGLTNGRLLIGDAKLFTWRLFGKETIADVYINYPDPWFKKRRLKRRVINTLMLQMLATRMTGVLTIATDDADYRDWVFEAIRDSGCWESLIPEGFSSQLEGYIQTKYERKWKAMGKPCYYMRYRKTTNPVFSMDHYITEQNLQFPLRKYAEELQSDIVEL